MAQKKCPLFDSLPGTIGSEIPEYCLDKCADIWDEAIKSGQTEGGYDAYGNIGDECSHVGGIVYSHDSLITIGGNVRLYVVVDECSDCGEDTGEQAYKFECPDS